LKKNKNKYIMNSNGFTKRNIFIGDVSISEDLLCGDMICQEMTLTGNINLDNQDIVGVNNLETKTINGSSPMTNPLNTDLDMAGNNITNNPQIDNLQDRTQNITVNELNETEFSTAIVVDGKTPMYNPAVEDLDMKNFNITNNPQIDTKHNC
jgi:hypothetical protein